jgi:hypothetical protein
MKAPPSAIQGNAPVTSIEAQKPRLTNLKPKESISSDLTLPSMRFPHALEGLSTCSWPLGQVRSSLTCTACTIGEQKHRDTAISMNGCLKDDSRRLITYMGLNSRHTTQNLILHAGSILQLSLPRRAKSERAKCGHESMPLTVWALRMATHSRHLGPPWHPPVRGQKAVKWSRTERRSRVSRPRQAKMTLTHDRDRSMSVAVCAGPGET